ncbi:hypothetical protein ACEWL3_013945 [Sulfitobacter sp. MF3-043]
MVSDDAPVSGWVSGIALIITAPAAFWFTGMTLARPVGLRMDENGVSGYFVAPLTWAEIDAVGVHETVRYEGDGDEGVRLARVGNFYLALKLYDRAAWWDRNSPLQRFVMLTRGAPKKWDVIVPLAILDTPEPIEIIHLAADLHEGR